MADKTWTSVTLLKTTVEYLAGKGVPSPKVDAEILLRHVLQMKTRVELYTKFDRQLTDEELTNYRALVKRRADREPVNRILGETEFMGLTFMVTPNVLAPRPETEILVEEAARILNPRRPMKRSTILFREAEEKERETVKLMAASNPEMPIPAELLRGADEPRKKSETVSMNPLAPKRVLDLCTGSGCVAIAIASLVRDAHVVATDSSPAALAVARENAEPHSVWERMDFREGDLWDACWEGETFDMVVSNPPYLVDGDPEIWPEVKNFDPPVALYGGDDGLFFYRAIAAEVVDYLNPGGHVLVETGVGQAEIVKKLFDAVGLQNICAVKDYAGIERVVCGEKAAE